MQTRKTFATLTALAIGLSSTLALADPPRRDERHDRYEHRDDRRDMRHDERRGPGAGPEHGWYRGDRLPREYRTPHVVVRDYRGHHLNAPPRGYQWVQLGADFALVAIASGIIAQVILSR